MAWVKRADGTYLNNANRYRVMDDQVFLARSANDDEWEVKSSIDGLVTTADTLSDAKTLATDYLNGML